MIEVYIQDRSLLLHSSDTGNWSEITPLPGWSEETLEDAMSAIFEEDFDRYPSVTFGMEMLYCENDPAIVPYAILLDGSPAHILRLAQTASNKIAKVKVGHLGLDETLVICTGLLEMGFKLRLDFNQQWSLDDALNFSYSFPPGTFEYLEEPTKEIEDFCKNTTQKVALDETIYTHHFWHLPNVSAIILKPPQWGGVGDCLELAQKTHMQNKQLVLSNTFKTRIGVQSLFHFAKLLRKPLAPLGLGSLTLPEDHATMEKIGVVPFESMLH